MLHEIETTENPEGAELYVAPASFAQTRLWLLDRLAPGLPTYNVPFAVRLSGPLSAGHLAAALADLVARHEALRTALSEGDEGDQGQGEEGEPVQLIHPELTPALPEIDLAALPAPRAEEEALRAARGEAARPFDLARAPLFRASLFRLAESEHLLLLNFHHIVIDAVSLGIVVRELFAVYEARAQGRSPSLAELPLQYADYAAWQRGWLVGEALEQKLRPFRRRLAGALPELALPTDRPLLPGASPAGAVLPFTLPASLVAGLAEVGRAAKATPFMVLLASFFALLSRHTGQEDLLVGTPVANRTHREIEEVVGLFVNTLVLRGDLSGDPAFGDLLARVRAVLVEALAHEDLPFEKLVEDLRPERRADRTPLFRVVLALQPAALPEKGTGGLGKALVPFHSGTAKFDLSLQLVEGRGGLSGFWEYAAALFDRPTILRLAGHWESLLAAAVADPGRRLGELPLLAPAERYQLTLAWNDTAAEYPREATLPELFAAQAARTPEAPALATAEGPMTYRELDRAARRLARRLAGLAGLAGITAPDAPVGVCLESGAERVVAFLGILYAGGAYLPLDPGYPEERLALMVADAAVQTILTRERLRGRLPAGIAVLSWEEMGLEEDGEEDLAGSEPWERRATPESLAYVLYTSGSTGRPKGIAVPHRAVIRLVLGTDYVRLGPEVRMAQAANASFDAVTFEIWGALLHGGCLVLVEREVTLAPEELAPALRDRGVTTLFLTTALFHRMASADPASFRTLSDLLVGGEAIDPSRVTEVLAAGSPGRLLNAYGPTEGTTFSTWQRLGRLRRIPPGAANLPIGRPLANTRVFLLDPFLQPAPIGVAGEIFLGGDGLARGYLGRPDLSALRFVPSPLGPEPGARLYRTGDLARFLPDGAIEFLGRADSQVKIRGFRIEPGEVDAALAAHPAVAECAVVARSSEAREAGEARELALVAYVAPRRGASLGPRELRDFLAGKLPDYMVPASFVELAALPKTPNGKVDRAALPEPAAASPLALGFVAPRNPIEEVLAGIWAWVLRLGPESRIGAHDNFFDLGGHSLTATLATAQARQAFAVDLPTRALFESPTLSELAREIEELLLSEQGLTLPPIVPRGPGPRMPEEPDPPLSFSQQRLWFLDELSEGESPFHNIAASLLLAGRLDIAALGRALSAIVRRHEALRTTFRSGPDGSPRQVIHPPAPLSTTLVDLSAMLPMEAEALARRIASDQARRPFSLARGPLLRADLLRLGPERHVLTLSVHHIVADGWSLEILVGELSALYAGSAPLPALPIQYADFAVWQRSWLAGPVERTQLDYWRGQLAGAPQVLELPADRPRPAVQSFRGATLPLALPAEVTDRLDALARERRATLFMALFTAFAALLGRITGQDDLVVGSPIAGRTRSEVRELIGFFVNMLLLRADLSGRPSFRQLLDRARETALGAYTHQDLPFERLVEELQPGRDASRNPLFQVSFALAGTPWHALSLPGLALEHREVDTETELFDLSFDLTRAEDGLSGRLSWSRDLFDPATILRFSRQLEALLSGLAAEPDRPVVALPLLSPVERREVEAEPERGPEAAGVANVVALFAARIAEQPAAPAFAWAAGAEISYEELDRRTNRLARRLRALGVGPETVVALRLAEPADFALAALAVWKAGGAYLPLVSDLPEERLAMLLKDSGARVVITRTPADAAGPEGSGCGRCSSRPSGSGCAPSSPDPSGPATVDLDWDRFLLAGESPEPMDGEPVAESAAYVLYTSGSTGLPKGVVVSHGALALHAVGFAERLGLSSADRVLLFTSFVFDVSLDELVPTLLAGGTLLPWRPRAVEPMEMARVLGETGATVVNLPTALWHLAARTWAETAPPPALRWVLVGGEAMPPGALGLWRRSPFAEVPLLHGYGTTETVITSTLHRAPEEDGRDLVHFSVGRPLPGRSLRLLDDEGELVPPGVPGEIFLGGPALARGYLGRPDRTAAAFVPDPWSRTPGARLYRTGDLGRRRESGEVEVLGRRDQQVKLRGVRIEIGEIEAALSAHPAVREAAVVLRESGAEDAPERKALVAFVSGTDGAALVSAELKALLSRRLPASMVPAAYVSLPDLPKTPGGKIDRAALALAAIPAVPREATQPAAAAVAPLPLPAGPPVEAVVAALWREILNVAEIGLDDNFFDLGGHSMLMAVVRARLLADLDIDLSLLDLYNHPTVRGLGELLRRKKGAPVPAPAAGPAPRVRTAEAAPGDFHGTEIAIVGMAGRFPGADDLATFWQNLRAGVDSITFFLPPGESWQPPPGGSFLVPAAGAICGADLWDADFFGASRREAEMMDPQQRLFLECAWEAWENAGYAPKGYPGRVGVFGGASKTDYAFLLAVSGAMDSLEGSRLGGVGTERDFLTTRVSYKLGFTGPSVSLQTACSTSLVAVDLACRSLKAGDCGMALAGGVSVSARQRWGYFHQEGGNLSPDGRCRPFDGEGQGSVDSDGVGIVVLKRLADALADGDTVRAVIRTSVVANDGGDRPGGFLAPSLEGRTELVRRALTLSGVPAESITYVEGHGNGTRLGDAIELVATTGAFRAFTDRVGFCALGSVKSNLGHANGAAGIASLIKTVLALEHREIPPTLHFTAAAPEAAIEESPFFVNTRLLPWESDGFPRRAGVTALAAGGTNAHLILEEAPPASSPPPPPIPGWQLLPLSARTATALESMAARLAEHLRRHPELALPDVAWTLQVGREVFEHRRVVLCRDLGEAVAALSRPAGPSEAADRGAAGEAGPLAELGRRWLAGDAVDWAALHVGERRRRLPLPTYPFERRRYWIDEGEAGQLLRQLPRDPGATAELSGATPESRSSAPLGPPGATAGRRR